jgi:CheY-like chemotaxis protein
MPHVLIVDDDPQLLEMLKEYLESRPRNGYVVEIASDGAAAVQAVGRRAPDAMILDMNMPGLGGLEVMQTVHRREPGLPVILLTAATDVSMIARALEGGAASYLPKPISLPYLDHLLAVCLQQPRPPR